MIVCSFNIRGMRGRVKRRRIKELIHKEKIDLSQSKKLNWRLYRMLCVITCGVVRIVNGLFFRRREIVVESSPFGGR
jgi:hypothetical protein